MNTVIQPDSLVTLHYRIAAPDGSEFVSTFEATPATLQLGSEELAPALERCLTGLAEGEHKVFVLEPRDAFGVHNAQMVARVPRDALPPKAVPELHGIIEFPSPDGSRYAGVVLEMDDEGVLVDFNHPLAGKTIRFEVHVVGIL
jgi:FKBP-type peptidyl-prolyl cis-trans isomerase SlpA